MTLVDQFTEIAIGVYYSMNDIKSPVIGDGSTRYITPLQLSHFDQIKADSSIFTILCPHFEHTVSMDFIWLCYKSEVLTAVDDPPDDPSTHVVSNVFIGLPLPFFTRIKRVRSEAYTEVNVSEGQLATASI